MGPAVGRGGAVMGRGSTQGVVERRGQSQEGQEEVRKLRDGAGEHQRLSQAPGGARRVGPARWKRYRCRRPHLGGGAGLLPGRCRSRGEFTEISGPCLRSRPDQWRRSPGGDVGTCGSGKLPPFTPRAELSLRSLTED